MSSTTTEFRARDATTHALEFDGTGDENQISEASVFDIDDTEGLTMSAWVKIGTAGNTGRIVDNRGGTVGYEFMTRNDVVSVFLGDATGFSHQDPGSTTITDNIVHHIAATVSIPDGNGDRTVTAYVDGDDDGSLTYTGIGDLTSSADLFAPLDGFEGIVDDIRIYNKELSSTQIANLNSGEDITDSLIGHWKFDEGSGSTAEDSSGNGNDGTLNGDPTYVDSIAASDMDTDLYDVNPLRDAFERFGSGAVLAFVDSDGTKIEDYPYGQPVDVQYTTDGGASWTTRFPGIALSAERTTRNGLPTVEVPLVGYNHLLTRESIEKDYSSTAKSSILQDVIETFTPVTWVAGNVNVQDDSAVDLSARGESPDEIISRIANLSAQEEWFVNDDLEFVFQQQDSARADPVTDADVIDYDLPREGERAINKFTVYYGSALGNSWTEEDREAQDDLKDKLSADRRVVIGDSDAYPEVSTEDEAKAIGQRRLNNQAVVQTGTITVPLGRFTTSAGDVVNVTIDDAGISGEDFRVAQIDYEWVKGEAILTVVSNTAGDVEELLIAMSDSLSNARLRDADTGATETLALRLQSGVTLTASVTLVENADTGSTYGSKTYGSDTYNSSISVTAVTVGSKKLTRPMLNLVRDLWQDGNSSFVDLTHVAVGTNDATATIADDSLQSEADRVAVESFGAGETATEFEIVATALGIDLVGAGALRELSVADASSGGNHYLRATYGDVSLATTSRLKVHIEVTFDNDAEEQGVITSKGQERLRDLVIGESNHEPSTALYGTGTTAAAESDTGLGSQQHTDSIDSTADGSTGIARVVERTTSAEADTTNWSEVGLENAANELLQRVVFAAYGSDVVLELILGMKARNA